MTHGTGLLFDGHMDVDGASTVLYAIAAAAGAGAGDAVKEVTKSTVIGTRDRLVDLVRKRLQKDPVGAAKLTVYAAEPTPANGQALQVHLANAGIQQDQEILTLAQELLRAAGPASTAPGSVAANVINQINKDGGTGFIGGQHIHHHGIAVAKQVRWELLRVHGSVFELRNVGDASAHDVVVTAESAPRFDPPDTAGKWSPGAGREFMAVGSEQSGPPIITVAWSEDGGERRTWARPLPW